VRLVLAGLVGSSAANGLLPVTESFAVLQVTGSVTRLGLILASQAAVALLANLAGGVAGDAWPRGRTLVASTAVRMTAAAAIATGLLTHSATFGSLLGVSVIYGCANGFFGPVSAAVLPDVVPPGRLGPANALIGGASSSANVIAPALAGAIVAALGPGAGFACESALLAVTATCLAAARIPLRPGPEPGAGRDALRPGPEPGAARDAQRPGPEPGAFRNLLRQLGGGWRVYLRLHWLWLLTLQWTAFSLLVLAPLTVLGPDIALRFLGGPAAWGAIGSCLTAGVVAGQFGAGRLRAPRPLLVSALLCPLGVAEAMTLGAGAPVPVIGIAAVVSGLAMGVQFVIFQTVLQRTVPGPVLARVAAFDLIGSELGQPAGYALAGPAGAVIGLRAVLTVGAGISVAATLPFALAPSLRQPAEALARVGAESLEPAAFR
jgi:Major Facilitator Superfamily